MSFAFVPRKVGTKKATTSASLTSIRNSEPSLAPPPHFPHSAPVPLSLSPADENLQAFAEDLAILIVLSLTDYAVWADGDMRRRLEEHTDGEKQFLPLRYVLKHSPLREEFLKPKTKMPSEASIVKALRTHAEDEIEVRMVLSGPTWSNWASTSSSQMDEGMYEVRPKKGTGTEVYTRDYWAQRTVYIENVPPSSRTTTGIYRFIQNISTPESKFKLQRISFPPHHLDADGPLHNKKPKHRCKGFAFVVFSSIEQVTRLSRTWNWDRHSSKNPPCSTATTTPVQADSMSVPADPVSINEAQKYGFRSLPKAQWDSLKEEYVAWRQKLLDEVFREQEQQQEMGVHAAEEEVRDDDNEFDEEEEKENGGQEYFAAVPAPAPVASSNSLPTTSTLPLTPSSPYPPNCLLFIRNIHSGTNKTTLRALFTKALLGRREETTDMSSSANASGIDYIDYTKGTDTCHLRLASPSDARILQTYFEEHHLVQKGPLDDNGAPSSQLNIFVELVQGTREKIYWEKVPLKVRQEAVRKAISTASANLRASASAAPPDFDGWQSMTATTSRPKKRNLSMTNDNGQLETEEWSGRSDKAAHGEGEDSVVFNAEITAKGTTEECPEDAKQGKRKRKRKQKGLDSSS